MTGTRLARTSCRRSSSAPAPACSTPTSLLDWVRRGSGRLGHAVSELAAPGEPQAWVYRAGEVGCAVLVVPLLPMVRAALPPGPGRDVLVGATAVFAAGAGVAGVVPTPCGPGVVREEVDRRPRSAVHDGASIISTGALYLAMAAAWLTTRRTGPGWFHRANGWLLAVGSGGSLVSGAARGSADRLWLAGLGQRIDILAASAWLGCLGVLAARAAGRARPAGSSR